MDKRRLDLRELGFTEDQIDEQLGVADEEVEESNDFEVYPDNWESVRVFVALSRCWNIDSFNGIYLGLDRPAIESTLRLMSIAPDLHAGIFEDLRVMEKSALDAMNK